MTIFKKLSVYDSTHIYAIASDDTLYMHNGASWSQLDSTALDDIDVTKDGDLFGIEASGQTLVKWSGSAWGSSLGAQTLKFIAAKSSNLVYAIASDDTIYYWNGAFWTQSDTKTTSCLVVSKV
jgi:hypothetical protein